MAPQRNVRKPVTTFYDPYMILYRSTLNGRVVIVVDHSRQDEGVSRRDVVSEDEWKALQKQWGTVRRAARQVVLNRPWYPIEGVQE